MPNSIKDTRSPEYARRLMSAETALWKRILHVQAIYRWNLRRLKPGDTLEVGCGIGRNLLHLNSRSVGIDHNPQALEYARRRGLTAITPDQFRASPFNKPDAFDTLLLAHVVEHMTRSEAVQLIATYLPNLKHGGRLILIAPQDAGFKSDGSHVEFMDFAALEGMTRELGLETVARFSFPFPRFVGLVFAYNEFVVVSRKGL
jgi:SAM-dependent methyltransferase